MGTIENLGKGVAHKFTAEAQERYLDVLRRTGRKMDAARAAGIQYETARHYINKNIFQMADRVEEAMESYRDLVEAEIHRRAIEGVPTPIIGGKDRDEIITYVQTYSDRLLEFHARRHISAYRQSQQIDLTVRGGVIAVPAQAPSLEAWAGAAETALLPTIEAEVIKETEEP